MNSCHRKEIRMTVFVSFVSSIPPLFAHSTPYFAHTHRATVALGAPSRGGGGMGGGPSRGPGGDPAHWVGHTPRRTTLGTGLGTGLARTGTNTGTPLEPLGKEFSTCDLRACRVPSLFVRSRRITDLLPKSCLLVHVGTLSSSQPSFVCFSASFFLSLTGAHWH